MYIKPNLLFQGLINWLYERSGFSLFSKILPSSENTIDEKSVIPGFAESNSFSISVYKSTSDLTLGLGPTKLMLPIKTLNNCVNSSILYFLIFCPFGIIRMSLSLVELMPFLSASTVIVLIFIKLNISKFFPILSEIYKGDFLSYLQTEIKNGIKNGKKNNKPLNENIISIILFITFYKIPL